MQWKKYCDSLKKTWRNKQKNENRVQKQKTKTAI